MSHTPSSEKDSVVAEVLPTETKQAGDDEGEVFKASLGGEDVAEFRTTSWCAVSHPWLTLPLLTLVP